MSFKFFSCVFMKETLRSVNEVGTAWLESWVTRSVSPIYNSQFPLRNSTILSVIRTSLSDARQRHALAALDYIMRIDVRMHCLCDASMRIS